MESVIRFQILGDAACISYSANSLEIGLNPTILSLAKSKKSVIWLFNLGIAIDLREGKLRIQTSRTSLKELTSCHILLMGKWLTKCILYDTINPSVPVQFRCNDEYIYRWKHIYMNMYTHICIYIYIYIYMNVW